MNKTITKLLSVSMMILLFGSIIAGKEQRREWPTARADLEELNLLLHERDDEGTDAEVTRRKKCKKFCSVLIRNCLAVNGTLFVNGVDLTTLVRIAGLLGPLTTSEIERLVSALELLALPPVAPFAPGFPGVGGLLEWAYIYWAPGADETVVDGDSVPFDTNGLMSPGILHTAGSDTITIVNAGIYKITYSATITSASVTTQLALSVNFVSLDETAPTAALPNTVYGYNRLLATGGQNDGQAIIQLAAGDILQLTNVSGGTISFDNLAGGTHDNVISSIVIERIG